MAPHSHLNPVDTLFAANAQWGADVGKAEPNFFEESAKGQTPHTLWIGCSDSRVPETVITASKPGDIFVHRNIANQFHPDDASVLSVIRYAVDHVGVQHVAIVGHTECGGAAACYGAASSQSLPSEPFATVGFHPVEHPLNRWLEPLTRLVSSLKLGSTPKDQALSRVVDENVKLQVENLAKSDMITQAWTTGTLKGQDVWIHGWVYDLSTGRLRDLNISQGPPNAKSY